MSETFDPIKALYGISAEELSNMADRLEANAQAVFDENTSEEASDIEQQFAIACIELRRLQNMLLREEKEHIQEFLKHEGLEEDFKKFCLENGYTEEIQTKKSPAELRESARKDSIRIAKKMNKKYSENL